ncbi:MAG: hypothetical protein IPG54_13945 [Sphingomonadales bacterium]|nr:hypothetical protein [Sphingomonadales bacterium]
MRRAYLNGANTDTSSGSTDARAWPCAPASTGSMWSATTVSALRPPSATPEPVTVDGYTETGGGFPVTVGRLVDETSEGRMA